MEKLKGKNILIGKEPGLGRLLIAIEGITANMAIGVPGEVPDSVSRCKAAQGVAHARVNVNDSGIIRVTNLKPQNVTFVGGAEIATKRVGPDSFIELGKDKYRVRVADIISSALKILSGNSSNSQSGINPQELKQNDKPAKKFNISHLEGVWNNLKETKKEIVAKQKKINNIRAFCGVFTMMAMPCCFFFGPIAYALTGVGIIGNIYSFIGLKNDNSTEVLEQLNETFQDEYVCPNCNKFLGNISYKLLKKQYSMQCPYCKCEFTEK